MAPRFPITLTQLTYFAECAEQLNMTAASESLHVSQSAVSAAVTHLETSLGTTLFIRKHARGLVLTAAGERLLSDTRAVFGMLSDAIDTLQLEQSEVRGAITIACFNTFVPFLLPPLVARLQERHPALSVEVLEGDYEENLNALRSGRAELAINYDLTEADDLRREIVGEAPPYVIVSEKHEFSGRTSVSLAELADQPVVLLDLPSSREYFLGILRQAGIAPNIKHRSGSYEGVRSLVAAGLGYSILNQRPRVHTTYSGALAVPLAIEDEVRALRIGVTSLNQVALSARAQAVSEALREVLGDQGTLGTQGTR